MQITPFTDPSFTYTASALAIPSVVCALIVFGLGVAIVLRERWSRVGWLHFFLSTTIGLWQAGLAFSILSESAVAGAWWARFTTVSAILIVPIQYHFALMLAGIRGRRWQPVGAVWVIAGGFVFMLFGTDWFVREVHHYSWGWFSQYGPAGWAFIAFTVVTVQLCSIAYTKLRRKSPPGSIAQRRARLLFLGVTVGGIGFYFEVIINKF